MPGHIIRTFQVPIRNSLLFLGTGFDDMLVGVKLPLSSMHPAKQADRGGTVPYWLGAAQLKAGGNGTMKCDDFSHRRR